MSQDLKKVDWNKPIRSIRTTSEVTFFCMDGDKAICKWKSKAGYLSYMPLDPYGRINGNPDPSVENVPPPKVSKTMLMILWPDGSTGLREPDWKPGPSWETKILAKRFITITEGEGLEF